MNNTPTTNYIIDPASPSLGSPDPADIIAGALQISRGHAIEMMCMALEGERERAAPQPEAAPLHKAVAAAAVSQSTALYNSIVEKRKAKAKHPDDAAVGRFAEAMKQKLSAARAKGRGGWDTPECTQQRLSDMLREHVAKGDPRDVANFCMFLWARGEAIAPPAEQQVIIDFAQVGTAGPFHVVNGRVKLPDATMQDLARMLRPTYEAEQATPKAAPAWADQAVIEYRYTGGTHWCPLGPAERMKPDFDGVYRLQGGVFPVEQAAPKAVRAPQQPEPIAWESTVPGYIKYVTQSKYEKFSTKVQHWYKPYKCSSCATLSDDIVQDAMRYAALRDGTLCHDDVLKAVKDPGRWEQPYVILRRGDELDSAIDAALAARGET